MEEVIYLSTLYDYYHELLTTKQRSLFEQYYFDNLTMQEISEIEGISKNAVSKQIDVVKDKLNEYERILKLKSKSDLIKDIIKNEDKKLIEKIEEII